MGITPKEKHPNLSVRDKTLLKCAGETCVPLGLVAIKHTSCKAHSGSVNLPVHTGGSRDTH